VLIKILGTTQHDWTALVSSRSYATKKTAAPAAKAKPKSKASGPQKSKKPIKNKKIKIVLTSDVPNVGVKGEDVEVAKGFARNYLFPQKLAVYCTEENLKLYEAERAVRTPFAPLLQPLLLPAGHTSHRTRTLTRHRASTTRSDRSCRSWPRPRSGCPRSRCS
jgi:hypothetical protein